MSQDFEGAWPATGWELSDMSSVDGGEYLWGKRDCHPHAGKYGGWAVGGGAKGNTLACSGSYPNNARSWAVYGPFDLRNATSANVTFYFWGRTEGGSSCLQDYFFAGSSIDGDQFSGTRYCGNWMGGSTGKGYSQRTIDLNDRLGQSQVWIGFVFGSDNDKTYEGITIDDVSLNASLGTPTTLTPTPTKTPPRTPIATPRPEAIARLPLILKNHTFGLTPTPTATPTATPFGPHTRLYPHSDGSLRLAPQASRYLWYLRQGNPLQQEWSYLLSEDLAGSTYGFAIRCWCPFYAFMGQCRFRADILLRHEGRDTILAGREAWSEEYPGDFWIRRVVSGLDPDVTAGDLLVLRVSLIPGSSDGGVYFGGDTETSIDIPPLP